MTVYHLPFPGVRGLPGTSGPAPGAGLPARRAFTCLAALLLILLAGQARGKGEPPDITALSLEELMKIDVVYGASKFEQRTSDAPASITIIRSEEIARHGYQTLADVLANVRGFYTTYDRNYDYLGVRGFGRPGDYNTRVLVLIDGIRQNDPIYSTSGAGTEFSLDLNLIERIEVIRGPGASLYGTNAVFAVINIVTKTATDLAGTTLEGSAGSLGLRSGRCSVGGGSSRLKWLAAATAYRRPGGDLFYQAYNTKETDYGMAQGVDGDRGRHLFGKLEWRGLSLVAAHSRREKGIPTGAWGTVFNDPRNMATDAITWVGLEWQRRVGNGTDLWSAVAYHHYNYLGDYVFQDYQSEASSSPGTILMRDRDEGVWWTAESRAVLQGIRDHRVTLGLEGLTNARVYQKTYDPYAVSLSVDKPSWNWSVYLQDDWQATSRILINAGARVDLYQTFGSTINPRASAVLRPLDGTTLKLLYGTAFRAPNAYESYYEDGGYTSKASPNLQPERIETAGTVLEQFLGSGSFATIEAFQYRLHDLIEIGPDPVDSLLIYTNRGRVEARGLELGVRREWAGGVVGRSGLVIQSARDLRTHEILSNSPRRLAYLNGSLPLAGGRGSLALDLRYVGDRATLDGGRVRAYGIGDVAVAAWVVPHRIRILSRVQNVLDTHYSDPGSSEHLQSSIERDGRVWRFSLTVCL